MTVGKMIFTLVSLIFSVYLITGFIIEGIQELKKSYWRYYRRKGTKKPKNKNPMNNKMEFICSMKDGTIKIVEYDFNDNEFLEEGVEAWRPLPPIYKKGLKTLGKAISSIRRKK